MTERAALLVHSYSPTPLKLSHMKRLLLASLSVIAVTTVCHADLAAASANAAPGHYLDLRCTVDSARRVIVLPAVEGGADVAVAMLDRRITTPDTLTTIASQLLLQSDLRGHIEDAAWYLRAPAQETIPAADALMLTQVHRQAGRQKE